MQTGPNALQHSLGLREHDRRELERAITVLCQKVLRVENLRVDQELFALGWDQPLGKRLLLQISERFGVDISVSVLRDSLTIAKLADLIQLKATSADSLCIIPIQIGGILPPLFLIHGVGGNVLGFFNLAKKFAAERPIYGIQAQALYSNGPALIRIPDMAACYLLEVRRIQPSGPYHFTGFSFGGLVAYEMAQQLRDQGEEVALLGMLDTWQPSYMRLPPPTHPVSIPVFSNLAVLYERTRSLSLLSKLIYAVIKVENRAFHLLYRFSIRFGKNSIPQRTKNVRELNKMAGLQYEVKPYDGKITLLRANDEIGNGLPLDLGWNEFARCGVEIHLFPGDHGQVLAEPNVSSVGDILTDCLTRSNGRANFVI